MDNGILQTITLTKYSQDKHLHKV